LQISAEAGELGYYLFAGADVNEVMASYTKLTGRMPLPPLWALGYQQCRYSYESQEEALQIAETMREMQIPCDVIYLDIHYMDEYRIFTWNQETFSNLEGLANRLHELGMKLVTIIDPGVHVKEDYSGYQSGIEEDIFLKYPDGKIAAGVVWPGLCHFPDFTKATARDWWKRQLAPLLQAGIDGLWNDMNEPLMFQNLAKPIELPDYVRHDVEGRGGTHLEYHNVYGLLMGQASRAALEEQRPGKRQFNIIRAGAAGAQRDSLAWGGDNHSTWDHLRLTISLCLQLGLSGVSFTGADVGGFGGDSNGELLTRWTQLGSLMPLFRNHSGYGTARQEPWSFDEEYTDAIRKAIELRYQLMPYLYTAFAFCSFEGQPIIRPLFTAEPENPHLRDMDDCYLLGDKLLVAPVLEQNALRRSVYLPDGDWHDFHTHQRYEGGRIVTVDAPLERLPLFVKSGTVLPMWPVMQHTGETVIEPLILRIYTDTGDTTLYQDSGEGLGYQQGDYRWVHFHMFETANSLTIERRIDGSYAPSHQTIELQLVGTWQEIDQIEVDGKVLNEWHTENDMVIARVSANFDTLRITTGQE
jgi:alpha-glucosidase